MQSCHLESLLQPAPTVAAASVLRSLLHLWPDFECAKIATGYSPGSMRVSTLYAGSEELDVLQHHRKYALFHHALAHPNFQSHALITCNLDDAGAQSTSSSDAERVRWMSSK